MAGEFVSFSSILYNKCHKVTLFFANMKAFAKKILTFVVRTPFINTNPIQKT